MTEASRRASIVEGVAVAAFVLWIAWPFVAPGGYVTDFDTIRYSGPNLLKTYQAFGEHRLPWWEPGIFGGTAFAANLQTAVLSPMKLLGWPFGAARGMGVITAGHLLVLGFGMRHLARRTLTLAPPAGFVAAAVMVGAGTTMVESVRFEQLAVVAWVPWLLVALDRLVAVPDDRRSWLRPIAWVALAVALIVLAGHPQQAYIAAVLAVVWVVVRMLDRHVPVVPLVGRLAAAGTLGIGIAALQLVLAVPLLRHLAVTPAAMAGEAGLSRYTLSPARLASAFLGDPAPPTGGAVTPTYETPALVGAAAIVLAVTGAVAWCARRRDEGPAHRATAFGLVGLVAGGFALALGPSAGLYRLAAAIVPGFGNGRVPMRWLFLLTFAVAVLAAIGTSVLLRDGLAHLPVLRHRHRDDGPSPVTGQGVARAVTITVGIIAVAAVATPWTTDGPPPLQRAAWVVAALAVVAVGRLATTRRDVAKPAVLAVALAAVVAVELGVPAWWGYARDLRGDRSFVEATGGEPLLAGLDARAIAWKRADVNANLTAGWRTVDGYDGGLWITDSWASAVRTTTGGSFDPILPIGRQAALPLDADALARLGVAYVVMDGHPSDAEARVVVGDWPGPEEVQPTGERWRNPAYRGDALVYPPEAASTAAPSEGTPARVTRPDTATIDVTTAPDGGAGRLVVAEQALPGWTVTVDGQPAELVPVDGFALGVDVPAGAHDVRLRYSSPGLVAGAFVSIASVVVTLALLVAGGRGVTGRRRQRPMDSAAPPSSSGATGRAGITTT